MTPEKKKKKLKVEKRPLEDEPEDPPVSEDEADEGDDTSGFFAPPYVPVMPSEGITNPISRPNLSPGTQRPGRGLSNG
jgi:hypothetical protein